MKTRRVVYVIASVVLVAWSFTMLRLWLAHHRHRHTNTATAYGSVQNHQRQRHVAPDSTDRNQAVVPPRPRHAPERLVKNVHDESGASFEAPRSLPSWCEERGEVLSKCTNHTFVTATSGRALLRERPLSLQARCICFSPNCFLQRGPPPPLITIAIAVAMATATAANAATTTTTIAISTE